MPKGIWGLAKCYALCPETLSRLSLSFLELTI